MSKIKLSYDFSDFKKDVMVLQKQHLQSNQKESYEKLSCILKCQSVVQPFQENVLCYFKAFLYSAVVQKYSS